VEQGANWLHMGPLEQPSYLHTLDPPCTDVMDGHFVPNITFGPQFIGAVHDELPDVYLDCHMMVSKPGQWIEEIAKAGGSSYTFHLEACESEHARVGRLGTLTVGG
jgi:ribulose-phosphate 3-epimerase